MCRIVIVLSLLPGLASADGPPVERWLSERILPPEQTMAETQDFIEPRVPTLEKFDTPEEFQRYADRRRQDVLREVVFRGEAGAWRDAETRVEWLDTIPGGDGYSIRKLRYEALPGMWVPALLYEPGGAGDSVPVMLAVNGHDGKGKAADYKQVRCINLAKRGVRTLNVEWFGMGQLRDPGFVHYAMNQIDLCGSSGLAPFYLAMSRGIDVLLSVDGSDPERVAVSGLSGGGWQTIFISALDTRVTLANPVAGYSSFRTRVRHLKDLGDSEQTPCDLATLVDYTHLTAFRAPRPTLLTFNSKDQCCFESGYAMQPLVDAAGPVFEQFGRADRLRTHVNHDPGTHNFERDNREALYRMVGDFFFAGKEDYSPEEIPCGDEVKTAEELAVPLPEGNLTFNGLASRLAKGLERKPFADVGAAREELRRLVRYPKYRAGRDVAEPIDADGGWTVARHRLSLEEGWTVPYTEVGPPGAKGTTIVLHDEGKAKTAGAVKAVVEGGRRALAADLFYFGEAKVQSRDFLFALLLASIGERPLGIQAAQLAALARGAGEDGVAVVAVGPRSSLIALVAAALEPGRITSLEMHQPWQSLNELLERNVTVNQIPEAFCFGLLEKFDIPDLIALVGDGHVKPHR